MPSADGANVKALGNTENAITRGSLKQGGPTSQTSVFCYVPTWQASAFPSFFDFDALILAFKYFGCWYLFS
jgi:hypothetical protein